MLGNNVFFTDLQNFKAMHRLLQIYPAGLTADFNESRGARRIPIATTGAKKSETHLSSVARLSRDGLSHDCEFLLACPLFDDDAIISNHRDS